MICNACNHEAAPRKGKCIYCGAVLIDLPPAIGPTATAGEVDPSSGSFERMVDMIFRKETPAADEELHSLGQDPLEKPSDSNIDLILKFGLVPTERKPPMSRMVLFIIFMVSGFFSGLIFWLMM